MSSGTVPPTQSEEVGHGIHVVITQYLLSDLGPGVRTEMTMILPHLTHQNKQAGKPRGNRLADLQHMQVQIHTTREKGSSAEKEPWRSAMTVRGQHTLLLAMQSENTAAQTLSGFR